MPQVRMSSGELLGESHQGQGKCQGAFGSAASQRHGLLSPELVTPGLSNASALPSEVQLMLHTAPSPGTHSGGHFRYCQSLLLPAYVNRKGPDIIQDKGLGRREKRGKEKIIK